MHMHTAHRFIAGAALAAGLVFQDAPGAGRGTTAILQVAGRSSQTPSIAASDGLVAVTWGASAAGSTDVFIATSRDAGVTFTAPVRVNSRPGDARLGGELPPLVELTPGPGPGEPIVTVLWTARLEGTTIRIARSDDGGRTFSGERALSGPSAPGDRGWPSLAADATGATHAFWLDHRGLAARANAAAAHQHTAHDGVAMAQRSALYYAPAAGDGEAEREVAKGVCYCCKTAAAVGPGGRVYAAWRHVYPGNIRDIAFTRSADGGRTFAPPSRVSDDGWQIAGCPDDGPALAVDRAGAVHVVWPTVLGGAAPEGALFHAVSRDGATFSPRRRIATLGSPKPSHPQIAIAADGRVVVAWDELIDGRRVVAARVVGGRGDGGPPIVLSGDGPGSYPVLAASRDGVLAAWSSGGEASAIRVRALQ